MINFNFEGKEPSSDKGSGGLYTPIGVIDIFEINEVKFSVNDNGNENFEIHFKREEDTFRDFFYLTDNAVPKFLNLYKKFTGQDTPPNSEDGIKTALMGKKCGLRVWGKINNQNGKVISCLNFGGFAFPISELSETKWNDWETKKINEFEQALSSYLVSRKTSNSEGSGTEDLPFNTEDKPGF